MAVEEVYTNAFDARKVEWTEVGDSPYLHDTELDNVNTSTDAKVEGDWTFPNSAGSGTINSVKLRLETRVSVVDCGDVLVYVWNGSSWVYAGVITPTTSYGWQEIEVKTTLDSWAKINGVEVYFVYSKSVTGNLTVRRLTRKVDYTVAAALASKRLLVGVGL
jgi:hypothetical protein